MRKFFVASLFALASNMACAAISEDLGGVLITSALDQSIFENYDVSLIEENHWNIDAQVDLLQHAVPEFTMNFVLPNETSFVKIEAFTTEEIPVAGSILFSYLHPGVLTAEPITYFYKQPTGVFVASATQSLGGGYGIKISDDPTCQSFSCMVPFQLQNKFKLKIDVRSVRDMPVVPEPPTWSLMLAGLAIPVTVMLRRKKTMK